MGIDNDVAFFERLNGSEPRVKTGTCNHCAGAIMSKRQDAKFCSSKCRTAACRKAHPKPRTAAEYEAEIASLRTQLLEAQEQLRAGGISQTAREGKIAREERISARVADKYLKRR
jgi:hypothetical protein